MFARTVLCVVTSVQHRIPEITVTQEEDHYKKTTRYFLTDDGYWAILTAQCRVLEKKTSTSTLNKHNSLLLYTRKLITVFPIAHHGPYHRNNTD